MRSLRYVICDVFTDTPLTGNQLAVFTDARGADADLMLSLTRELGFSESVFVLPAEAGGDARLRIFQPLGEMEFAGHPILGTAFVLGGPLQRGVLELETGVGLVAVTLDRDESGRIVFGRMRQPVPAITLYERADEALRALGVGGSELPVELYDNGARHVVVTLRDVDALAGVVPDIAAIARHDVTGIECIAPDRDDWRMRMFWANGEDAATGSAAGPVACHLARHGRVAWGAEVVLAQGVEMGRPSRLHAWAAGGDGLVDAVEVGGAAVVVARGEFRV